MNNASKTKHLVVLMLENRSFDHVAGYLRISNPKIDGILGTEFNFENPNDESSPKTLVSDDAPYVPDLSPGPGHDVRDVAVQIYAGGSNKKLTMGGFVYDYSQQTGVTPAEARKVMRCFSPAKLQVFSTLAQEFAICDHWHSSLPGPTWPNRLFLHCATSGGFIDNNPHKFAMPSIFERLSDIELDSWRIYYHDTPQTFMLQNLRNARYIRFFEQFDAFGRDCRNGTLPKYSFIEPRYFSVLGLVANDQHPDHGVIPGEKLIADVYNAVRSSPLWTEILLLVIWDEHGGFYDHVEPEATVNPDGLTSPEFDFTLLGVRVPALLISPWIPKGTVDDTVYDHASIAATLKRLFGTREFLTRRDAEAKTFENNCSLSEPRPDVVRSVQIATTDFETQFHGVVQGGMSQVRPPTELQRSLVALANDVSPEETRDPKSMLTELDAAHHVYNATARALATPREI